MRGPGFLLGLWLGRVEADIYTAEDEDDLFNERVGFELVDSSQPCRPGRRDILCEGEPGGDTVGLRLFSADVRLYAGDEAEDLR